MTFQKGHKFYGDLTKSNYFQKGNIPWSKGTKGVMKAWNKGKTNIYSEETKRKISENTKKGMTEEICKRLSEIKKKAIREGTLVFPIKDTTIEVKIQNFLTKLHIEYFTHKYMKIEQGYQCDIFIPKQETEGVIINKKTIIEADGCYWHGCPSCKFNKPKNLKKQKQRDFNRTKELIENGYKVIRLWEHEIKLMELNDFQNILGGFR